MVMVHIPIDRATTATTATAAIAAEVWMLIDAVRKYAANDLRAGAHEASTGACRTRPVAPPLLPVGQHTRPPGAWELNGLCSRR